MKNFGLFHAAFLLTKIQGEQCLLMISERRTFSEICCVFLSNALFRMRHLRVGVSVASVTRFSGFEAPSPRCVQNVRRSLAAGFPAVPAFLEKPSGSENVLSFVPAYRFKISNAVFSWVQLFIFFLENHLI